MLLQGNQATEYLLVIFDFKVQAATASKASTAVENRRNIPTRVLLAANTLKDSDLTLCMRVAQHHAAYERSIRIDA